MRWALENHHSLYAAIVNLPWLRDGLDNTEKAAIDEILSIAVANPAVAKAIFGMSFLIDEYPARKAAIQQGRYDTDYTRNLAVTILRAAGNAPGEVAPDLVAESVRLAENIMQMPLPTDNVIIVVDDRSVIIDWAFGINYGFAIGLKQQTETTSREQLLNTLVHEIAHYWWSGNADWIDEGAADTIAATASAQQGHTAFSNPNRRDACTAVNISDIGATSHSNPAQFHCNYYLGEKLFRAIQDAATPDDFAAGLQRLYRMSRLQRYGAGIQQIRQAFPDHAAIIEQHWSGDLNAPHRWDPDDDLPFTSYDAVVWTEKPTYWRGQVSFAGYLQNRTSLVNSDVASARRGHQTDYHQCPQQRASGFHTHPAA